MQFLSTCSTNKSVKPWAYIYVSRQCNLYQFVSTQSSDHFDSTQNMLKNILRMPAILIRSNPIKRLQNPQLNPFQIFKYAAVAAYLTVHKLGLNTNSIFFCFPFCKKSLICLEGKSMTPHRVNAILFRSSQQLPRLRVGPSKGFFELTQCPSRALDSPCVLHRETMTL